MSLPVRLGRATQAEYDDAADWYQARGRGLGRRFVASLRGVLAEIGRRPDRYPETWSDVREAPADYEDRLRDARLGDPVVVVPKDFEDDLLAGESPRLEIVSDSANQRSESSTPCN